MDPFTFGLLFVVGTGCAARLVHNFKEARNEKSQESLNSSFDQYSGSNHAVSQAEIDELKARYGDHLDDTRVMPSSAVKDEIMRRHFMKRDMGYVPDYEKVLKSDELNDIFNSSYSGKLEHEGNSGGGLFNSSYCGYSSFDVGDCSSGGSSNSSGDLFNSSLGGTSHF